MEERRLRASIVPGESTSERLGKEREGKREGKGWVELEVEGREEKLHKEEGKGVPFQGGWVFCCNRDLFWYAPGILSSSFLSPVLQRRRREADLSPWMSLSPQKLQIFWAKTR